MKYRFATQDLGLSDYASGKVFYGLPGSPALPVRLANEVFQTCLAHDGYVSVRHLRLGKRHIVILRCKD